MARPTDLREGAHEAIEGSPIYANPIAVLTREETRLAKEQHLEALERRIFEKCLTVIDDALCCVDIDPQNPRAVPREWEIELGGDIERIEKRRRTALAANVPSKDCPAGIQMAKSVAIGVMRSRGNKEAPTQQLNVQVVNMGLPAASYPSITVGSNEE